MKYEDFKTILGFVERDITHHQVIGGHKFITLAERLTLAICYIKLCIPYLFAYKFIFSQIRLSIT